MRLTPTSNCTPSRIAITSSTKLRQAKLEKNSSALFTTETRRARRGTENPDASVKSPCPPRLRGETGRLAAPGSLSESQMDFDARGHVGAGPDKIVCPETFVIGPRL